MSRTFLAGGRVATLIATGFFVGGHVYAQNTNFYPRPALVDLDGDGDLDAAIGYSSHGRIQYLENVGTISSPDYVELAGRMNPFDAVPPVNRVAPAFGDVDGDGDMDVVVGSGDGTLGYLENTGNSHRAIFAARTGGSNPFAGLMAPAGAPVQNAPTLADFDGDGDLDAVVGAASEDNFVYLENMGSANLPAFVRREGALNPFEGVLPVGPNGADYSPAVEDLDGDGDVDMVVGGRPGRVYYLKNIGSTLSPIFVLRAGTLNPFSALDYAGRTFPALGDLDGDGDPDLLVGHPLRGLAYHQNTGTRALPSFTERLGARNPFDAFTRHDQDRDGIDDEFDNCPDTPNPSQSDMDGDGLGDSCDPDLVDWDADGIVDALDNCPYVWNLDQADSNEDGIGDVCDPELIDSDYDGWVDARDNCPSRWNPDQADVDGDGIGDGCDEDFFDYDGDGIPDELDLCPTVYDRFNLDSDGDGRGDACEFDDDNDGILDRMDNCPTVPNPGQEDGDGDGVGDVCDNCPLSYNPHQSWPDADNDGLPDACEPGAVDTDGDGIVDSFDNCPIKFNPRQEDTDNDGVGDLCESGVVDSDDDGVQDVFDNCPTVFNPRQLDFDNDGIGDMCDPDSGDADGDGVRDVYDNCPLVYNPWPYQWWDGDNDGVGDACDPDFVDTDGDMIGDFYDNCPTEYNPTQADSDNDGVGDACESDADDDGIPDVWETGYGLSDRVVHAGRDTDGDRVRDEHEYVMDTDPRDRTKFLHFEGATDDGELIFTSSSARVYTLECAIDPTGGNPWQEVPGYIDVPGTGGVLTWTRPAGSASITCRIKVEIP